MYPIAFISLIVGLIGLLITAISKEWLSKNTRIVCAIITAIFLAIGTIICINEGNKEVAVKNQKIPASTKTEKLVSNDECNTYIVKQNQLIYDTRWDVTITVYDPYECIIAQYLVKNDNVFLFNESGISRSHTMTLTWTPWTIEDIEKMENIDVQKYLN